MGAAGAPTLVTLPDGAGHPLDGWSMTHQPDDIDPTAARTMEEFAGCLRRVRARADNISYRRLEQWGTRNNSPLPRSTVVDVLAGRRLPRKTLLLAFLQACGVNPRTEPRWVTTWNRLSEQHAAKPPAAAGSATSRTATNVMAADQVIADARARAGQIIAEAVAIRAAAEQNAALLRSAAQRQVDEMHAQAERELRRHHRFAAELAADVRAAGLLRIGANYLNGLDWDRLFADVHELDIFVAYGQTWRNLNIRQLHKLARQRGSSIRIFLPDVNDEATTSLLANRFAIAPEELIRRIESTRESYEGMRYPDGARIELYYFPGDRMFSFYRLDDTVVVGFYSHSRNRFPSIPVFVGTAPGSLYEFILEELRAIEQKGRLLTSHIDGILPSDE
ncbi:hypothetical protein [Frankia sp. Cr1]|uniref:hypothetical protein n=1 Tax=Frankia sp. Cr1 TaxID=3073931 RepID=UPI002AD526A3|nr:hypothetical protein [Frankia sp. Cr1]